MAVNRPVDWPWFSAGGEGILQALLVGPGVRKPMVVVQGARALTASNPRRVGWGVQRGGNRPSGRWVLGERSLLARDQTAIRLDGRLRLNAASLPGRGDATGARSGLPLPRGVVLPHTSCARGSRSEAESADLRRNGGTEHIICPSIAPSDAFSNESNLPVFRVCSQFHATNISVVNIRLNKYFELIWRTHAK